MDKDRNGNFIMPDCNDILNGIKGIWPSIYKQFIVFMYLFFYD